MTRHVSALVALLLIAGHADAADGPFNTKTLRDRLAAKPTGEDAKALAADVRKWAGTGGNPKVEELDVTWVVAPKDAPTKVNVVSQDGTITVSFAHLADTDLWIASVTLPDGRALNWRIETDGKPMAMPAAKKGGQPRQWSQLEVYKNDPDGVVNPSVPMGKVTPMPKWSSQVFEGTTRDWWVYVPAQYKAENPASVMVFQDGGGYTGFVPTVFDNLIAKGEMPITVAIFINPGAFTGGRSNRSFEYDTLSDQYARFLLTEILPEVEKTTKLRHDAASRAIAGISSGAICAWTVAWEKPEEFSKVLSWVGSFTNIASGKTGREGGHNYEAMIRKTRPTKSIRVFLQDGSNDLDNNNGSWPLANQTMAKSLAFSGYDYKFVMGEGFHSNRHGRAVLSDSLRWLWRDATK